MMLNRRETLGALSGLALGFLFRGRGGQLQDKPARPAQKPSAITITTVPQYAFRVERLNIPVAIASAFVIEDIQIGGESQFAADVGAVPATIFANMDVEGLQPCVDPAGHEREIKFRVRYIGDKPEGVRFYGALIGTRADGKTCLLPIDSGTELVA